MQAISSPFLEICLWFTQIWFLQTAFFTLTFPFFISITFVPTRGIVIFAVVVIIIGAFVGNYVQQNKDEVKEKLKNFIDRL